MRDVARENLDDAGAVLGDHGGGDVGRLVGRPCEPRRRAGDVISLQHARNVHHVEPLVAARERVRDDLSRGFAIRFAGGQPLRRGHERVAAFAPVHEMHEAAHGAAGVMGNGGARENFIRARLVAKPHGEHRLRAIRRAAVLDHRPRHRACDLDRLRQRRGAVDHHRRVRVGVFQDRAERGGEARGVRVADDVGRIGARPRWRHRGVERLDRVGPELRELAAQRGEFVDRKNAESAAVGQDRELVAFEGRDAPESFGRREQFVDVGHAQHARAAEGGAVNVVRAGERAGVRGRRARRAFAAPRLDDDDGLHARGRPRRRHERLRVGDRLDVHEDRARRGVDREPVQQIVEIDVGHVADGHEPGKADVAFGGEGEQRNGDRARLRDHGEIALGRTMRGEARVEARARRQHAEAIRPDHAHARSRGDLLEARAQRFWPVTGVRGDDDGRGDAETRGFFRQRDDMLARRRDDDEIGRRGQVADARGARHPVDLRMARVDEMDAAAKAALPQVPEHGGAKAAGPRAGAHERYGARLKQAMEIPDAHGGDSCRRFPSAALAPGQVY